MIKKILKWIWKGIIATVITGCILTVITTGISTNAKLYDIEDQLFELYEISAKTQNTIVRDQKRKEAILLYIMGQIDSSKTELKQEYDEKLKLAQENIENRFKKEQPLSYEYMKKVTVRIFATKEINSTSGWIGTGIIVKITKDFTYILTNKHLAPLGTNVYVNKNGKIYRTKILKNSIFNDLSLIRMDGKFSDKEVVRGFADYKIQEKIYSVGMYKKNHFIYTEGTVAGINITKDLLVNLPSSNGCSGSGIFNSKGEVIGLLFGSYMLSLSTKDTSKAICIPASAIKVFLREFLDD